MNCYDYTCIKCDALPEVDFNICSPNLVMAQVSDLYITKPGHGFIDVEDTNELIYRLALPVSDPSRILNLKGIGEKPMPISNTSISAFNKSDYSNKTHNLPFVIHEVTQLNYEMMRYFEIYPKALFWFATGGGKMFGGNSGNECQIYFNSIIPKDIKDIERLEGQVIFNSKQHPCRTNSVI